MKILRRDAIARPAGLPGAESMEIFPRRMRVGDTWCETLAIAGYPREVEAGWLEPLLSYAGPIDVAIHVDPMPSDEATRHLRRQLARLESTRRIEAKKDRLADPEIAVAVADATELGGTLARGEGKLFRAGMYVTVRAHTEDALAAEVQRVRAICASMLLQPQPVTFRAQQGWITTLPLGLDAIKLRRTFDTRALAAVFPFASAEFESSGGILYGRNAVTGGLVFVDRFAQENHNQVILARSGAGKSYLAKLEILRSLYEGVEVLVVDPENEYERLARAVGGVVVRLGADGARLNPLDLGGPGRPEALTEQALFVHTLTTSLIGEVSPEERAALDRGILGAYQAAGITADPRTHARPAPLLRDVCAHLRQSLDGVSLSARLAPYVSGSFSGLFDRPTTVRPRGHLVVFSLRDLPDELKTPGTLLVLDSVWRHVARGERRRRLVAVDEAWLLLRAGRDAGGLFLQRLAKSARKHWCGLLAITQDVADMIATDLGQAVITNASHQVLLGQSPQAIDALARAFNLSEGECSYLLSCDRGQGILAAGTERAAIDIVASETEHRLVTSDPAEIAAMEERA
jgi:type IV secretory pathway VirB4 component